MSGQHWWFNNGCRIFANARLMANPQTIPLPGSISFSLGMSTRKGLKPAPARDSSQHTQTSRRTKKTKIAEIVFLKGMQYTRKLTKHYIQKLGRFWTMLCVKPDSPPYIWPPLCY
jgi:hypothetical protein